MCLAAFQGNTARLSNRCSFAGNSGNACSCIIDDALWQFEPPCRASSGWARAHFAFLVQPSLPFYNIPPLFCDVVNSKLQAASTAMAFWGGNAAQRCFLRWRRYLAARRHKHHALGQATHMLILNPHYQYWKTSFC